MFVDVSAEELVVVMNKGYAEMCLCVGWGVGQSRERHGTSTLTELLPHTDEPD